MVNRVVVGAHYGLLDWLMQRITAVVMVFYVLVLVAVLLFNPHLSFDEWQGLFANEFFKLLTFLFLISVYLHAWVGMRDILMDYIKPVAIRLTLEVLIIAALVIFTGWAIHILWGLSK